MNKQDGTRPKMYKARYNPGGQWVTGWYVETHLPRYADNNPEQVIGYDTIPCIFCDDEGKRNRCYWYEIDPATLQEANEPEQLSLFVSE